MKHTFDWDLQHLCKHLYNMVNIYDHEFIILSTVMSVQYVASQQSQELNIQWNTRYAFIGNKKPKWTDVKIRTLSTIKLNQFTCSEWDMHICWKFLHIFSGNKFSFASLEMAIRNILYCYNFNFQFSILIYFAFIWPIGLWPIGYGTCQYRNKVTNIIHDVRYNRYNKINLRMYLNRQHSDWNVAAESYISYGA